MKTTLNREESIQLIRNLILEHIDPNAANIDIGIEIEAKSHVNPSAMMALVDNFGISISWESDVQDTEALLERLDELDEIDES